MGNVSISAEISCFRVNCNYYICAQRFLSGPTKAESQYLRRPVVIGISYRTTDEVISLPLLFVVETRRFDVGRDVSLFRFRACGIGRVIYELRNIFCRIGHSTRLLLGLLPFPWKNPKVKKALYGLWTPEVPLPGGRAVKERYMVVERGVPRQRSQDNW